MQALEAVLQEYCPKSIISFSLGATRRAAWVD
jgi:hypothetical protein